MIQFSDVNKSFAEPLLRNFSLKISRGELVVLLGPSGCGKSTLLRLAAGLLKPDSGRVEIESGNPLGFVFQEANLLPWLTAEQNVNLSLSLVDVSGTQKDWLSQLGLAKSRSYYPHQLSGGMKMRVALARALVLGPSLLLLDEPFSALDETTRHRLQVDLRRLAESMKLTCLFVTHSISEAAFLGDRVVVLGDQPLKIVDDMSIQYVGPRNDDLRVSDPYILMIKNLRQKFREVSS